MLKSIARIVALCVLIAGPLHTPAFATDVSGHASVAYQKKKDATQAREDALRAALQDAVRRALSQKLSSEQILKYNEQIETQVLPLAKSLVSRYSVVDERDAGKVYEMTISATVDDDLLTQNLDMVGFSMDVGSRHTVAVVIDEYFSNDLPPQNEPLISKVTERSKTDSRHDVEVPGYLLTAAGQKAAADAAKETPPATQILPSGFGPEAGGTVASGDNYYESKRTKDFQESIVEYFPAELIQRPRPNPVSAAAIGAALLKKDVRLVDAGQVASIRSGLVGQDGLLLSVLSDPATLSTRAMKIGAQSGTDAVMVGTTAIVYSGETGGRFKAEATLAVRVVDTSTGDIVAYATTTEVGLGSNSEAAASNAAERLGDEVGATLGEQMFQYWRNRQDKGLEISVTLVGVTSTKLAVDTSTALMAVQGVKSVEQRTFDRTSGLLSFTMTTKLSPTEVKASVLRALYGLPEFKAMEEESSVGTNWNFVVH